MLSIRHLTRLCRRLWDGMATRGKSEMTIRLPRRTLTAGVMGGVMVCGTMVIAQSGDLDQRSPQTGDRNLTLNVNDPGPGRIASYEDNPGCPASSCVSQPGQCTLTQSLDTVTIETQVSCHTTNTARQGWARCFDFAAEGIPTNPLGYTIQNVTFGVLVATADGILVDVVVYTDDDGCPSNFQEPGDGTNTEIARESIMVNEADVDTFITVHLSDKPKVSDDANIIVEIEQVECGEVPPPDNFSFEPSGNRNGECAISYIRAPPCGLPFWLAYDRIGFDFIHTTMVVALKSNPLPPCPWDLDGDGVVAVPDLLELIASFGPCDGNCPADFDGDGIVGVPDLLALIANFGPCPGSECVWDVNGDGFVDNDDLQELIANQGPCDGCPEDVNGDGIVNGQDVAAVAMHFGPCP